MFLLPEIIQNLKNSHTTKIAMKLAVYNVTVKKMFLIIKLKNRFKQLQIRMIQNEIEILPIKTLLII